jgi:membrane-associated phospholipid phosphatase
MGSMSTLRPRAVLLGLAALGLAATIAICVAWIDRPVSLFAARLHLYSGILDSAPVRAPVLVFIAALAVLWGSFAAPSPERLSPLLASLARSAAVAGLAVSWAVCVTEFLLKPIFGRTLPAQYLQNGTYAFHWFSQNTFATSFPSGHSAQIVAIAAVFWAEQPWSRFLCVIAVGCVSIALILAEKHFLGDIIAGSVVGLTAGLLMQRLELLFRSS